MFILFIFIYSVLSEPCATGKYWNQQNGACESCPIECASCWSLEKCTSCVQTADASHSDGVQKGPFYLDSEYKCVARKPNPHCATWDGLYCIECQDGYYIQDMNCDNECGIEGCIKCNSQKCFKCGDGLTLYETTESNSLKQECIDCKSSDNDEKCGRCPLGQYFDTDEFKCKTCREGCDRCTTKDNCYLCSGDTALATPSDPTSACITLPNCEAGHYYGNHCELCQEGFFVKEGYCSGCGDNCARCIDENTCVECKQGSTLSGGKCTNDPHCIRSSDLMGCIECEEGHYLKDDGKCYPCSANCASCLNENYCFRCAKDYYFTDVANGVCEQIDKGMCSVADQFGCLQCKYDVNVEGFTTDSETFAEDLERFGSIKPDEGEEGENTQQTQIYYGFYLPYEYNEETEEVVFQPECRLCNTTCRICEYNENWCTGCNEGYEMKEMTEYTDVYKVHFKDETTQIHTCVPKSAECEKTEMGYCIKCVETHFLSGIKCVQCNPSCATCTDQSFCITCNNETLANGNTKYWRPQEKARLDKQEKGHCLLVEDSQSEGQLLHCKDNKVELTGCTDCADSYYLDQDKGDCFFCGAPTGSEICKTCTTKTKKEEESSKDFNCTSCFSPEQFLKNGKCLNCTTIEHCIFCNADGCEKCEDGYNPNGDRSKCTRVPLELILPLVGVGLIFIIIIIVVIVVLIWRKRRKTMQEREKEIKPFKVSNEVEMALLSADNENFPLKTSTWTLDFGHAGSKVNIDTEYEQTIQIMNPTKKSYFFEILSGASHKYELTSEPMRFTLKPDYAIEVKFTIKMLCTAIVKDEIGIVAMDMDEELKETAKITILIESDLSTKLDHQELKLQMPAIGEGAFGMVFVGTYRGQKVAVKKMKARNLTEEQEKEFKHEVNMLTQYRHACIVNLVGAVYTEGEISIVTEFADYGSLSKVWGKEQISYDLKIKFMEDAVVALSYLHENNIIHRDVKGENVLVYSLNPHSPVCGKLTDFGTCRNISERSLATKPLSQGIGTPTYMAPECLGNSDYSYSADVYSFSIVLYETFTEIQAYIEDERFNQPWMIPQFVIEGNRLERPDGMTDAYWALIEQCWAHKAEDRPTFPQIYATLASWGLDICNTEMSAKAAPLNMPNVEEGAGEGEAVANEQTSSSSSSNDEE